ncbi:protein FAR1-RELATED SEQUENCE 6-like [Silene latifolia]|uniref:protein FAR1-RELATED SEQUENCE 6-like n=1 Tax=Silene latifolia TaxID=37657 RepID=UPI003D778F34
MRNGAKNLGSNPRYNEIKADLKDVVYESKDIHDFEDAWELFVVKYGLREHSWVKEVYAKREAWVPLYWKNIFCAGMSSTQRSEQTNRFFKIYFNPQTTLFTFLANYENALRAKVEEEEKLNFACTNKPCRYDKNVIVEEVFQRAYSNSIFAKVKKEVYGLIHTNAEIKMNIGTFSLFVVTEEVKHPFWKARDKMYDVSIDTASGEFTCTCQRFEFKGILCRHIIRALLLKKVQLIPDKYILSRFRKDLVRGYEHIQVGYHTPAESERLKRSIAVTLRNGYLYRLALHSDEAFALYNRESQKLVKELEASVGIETLNAIGAGTNVNQLWGRRRLQRKENNQRYMVRNATPRKEGGLEDPVDKRGTGRAPRPRQKTVRRALNVDEAGPSQPTPQRRRVTKP